MAALTVPFSLSKSPLKILNRGPDFFREQALSNNKKESRQGKSARELLEETKGKYVKSVKVRVQKQEPAITKNPNTKPKVKNKPNASWPPAKKSEGKPEVPPKPISILVKNEVSNSVPDMKRPSPSKSETSCSMPDLLKHSQQVDQNSNTIIDTQVPSSDGSQPKRSNTKAQDTSDPEEAKSSEFLQTCTAEELLSNTQNSLKHIGFPLLRSFKQNHTKRHKQQESCRERLRTRSFSGSSQKSGSLRRSKSDVGHRFPQTQADIDKFFNTLGFDKGVSSPLRRAQDTSTQFFSDSNSVSISVNEDRDSADRPDGEEADMDRIPEGPSVIERNARIIKWMYHCKKEREYRPTSGVTDL
ncbi:protein FAM110B-like [Branchiostoma lanceolatum]|uniref:protein FAM110B-like n=1 Tax=Branchiostoma lanceolatum TaxID=7740 RepID=UPI0034548BC1